MILASFALALGIAGTHAPAVPVGEEPELRPVQETLLLLGGGLAQLGGHWKYQGMPDHRPEDFPEENLAPWDRWAAGYYSPTLSLISDLWVLPVTAALPLFDAWLVARGEAEWKDLGTDLVLLTEALAWSSGLNLAVRSWRIHPRPLVYSEAAPESKRRAPEAGGGFYSGHANAAFAGAVTFALLAPRRWPALHRGWAWTASLAAAGVVAGLRVAAGRHFPSDVMVGAGMGSLFAAGTVYLHQPRLRGGGMPRQSPSASFHVSPLYPLGMAAHWLF